MIINNQMRKHMINIKSVRVPHQISTTYSDERHDLLFCSQSIVFHTDW